MVGTGSTGCAPVGGTAPGGQTPFRPWPGSSATATVASLSNKMLNQFAIADGGDQTMEASEPRHWALVIGGEQGAALGNSGWQRASCNTGVVGGGGEMTPSINVVFFFLLCV
jgi:hypothetical protein